MKKLWMILLPVLLSVMACGGGHDTPPAITSQLMPEGAGDERPRWYPGDEFEELRLTALAQ